MALITIPIPVQGFEIVRDAIAANLKTEILNQETIQSSLTTSAPVFVSRVTPFSQSENIMINVLLDTGNYGSITEVSSQGSVNYFIDIYTRASANQNQSGGENSGKLLARYLGIIRFILSSTKLKTLNLPLGTIGGTYFNNFEFFEPTNVQDSANVRMCRIEFSVRILENQDVFSGVNLERIFTQVKLDSTELGYQYNVQ